MYLRNAKSVYLTLGLCLVFLFSLMPPLDPAFAAARLEWSGNIFRESVDNAGAIGNSIQVQLIPDGGSVVFTDSDDLVADGRVRVTHLPAGLTCRVRVIDSTHCRIYLDGNATAHQAADNIDNLNIMFYSTAFEHTDGGMGSSSSNMEIQFEDNGEPPAAEFKGSVEWPTQGFTEAAADDGSIGNSLTIELGQDSAEFNGFEQCEDMIGDGRVQVNHVPAGLTCQMAPISHGACTVTLAGQATNHTAADSITNLEIIFLDSAFDGATAAQVRNSAKYDIPVTFIDGAEPPVEPPVETHDIVATFSMGSTVYYVNGVPNNMDAVPYAEGGRTFVPVRYLAYCLGMTEANVDWDNVSKTATISENGFNVMLTIGSMWINVDGTPQLMDATPQIQGERILLPARFVAEAFGATVEWVEAEGTVIINRDM